MMNFFQYQVLHYLKEMLVAAIPAAAVFLCFWPYRSRAMKAMGLRTSLAREVGLVLFVMFLFGVLAVALWPVYMVEPNSGNTGNILLLVDRPGPLHNVNLIPFRMFSDYIREIRAGGFTFTLLNFVGNLAVFVPLGFFPALLFRGARWQRSALVGFATSLLVECGQYFVVRSTDIDDIILNTLGALCGYWLFLIFRRLAPKWADQFRCREVEPSYGDGTTGDRKAPGGTGAGQL